MNSDWRTRYDLAVSAAHKAGDLARTYYETTFAVEHKGDNSPVTIADKNAEKLIREAVSAAFPGDGFLGQVATELDERFGIGHATLQIERGDAATPCRLAPDDVV